MSGLVGFFAAFLSPPTQTISSSKPLLQHNIEKDKDDKNNSPSPTEVVVTEKNSCSNNKNSDNENKNSNDDISEYDESLESVRRVLDLQSHDGDSMNDDMRVYNNYNKMNNNDRMDQYNNGNNSKALTQDGDGEQRHMNQHSYDNNNLHQIIPSHQEQQQQSNQNNNDYVDIEEWKLMESKKLTAFIRKRITEKDEDDDDGNFSEESDEYDLFLSDDDDDDDDEDCKSPESSPEDHLETQEYQQILSPITTTSTKRSDNGANHRLLHRSKKIPHISETTHVTNKIPDINLHSHVVNLNSVLVLKITPLLSTKRFNHWNTITTKLQQHITSINASVLVPSMDFYGPLVTAYKEYVCCVQLVQHQPQESPEQHQLKEQGSQMGHKNKIYIFFYDDIARSVQQNFEVGKTVISIMNIPSKCIFPSKYFHVPTSTLLETTLTGYKTCKYCICIGGKSRIAELSESICDSIVVKKHKLYFSDKDMAIRIISKDVNDNNVKILQKLPDMQMATRSKRSRDHRGDVVDEEHISTTTCSPSSKRLKSISEEIEDEDEIEEEEEEQMIEMEEDVQEEEVQMIATQFHTPNDATNSWKANNISASSEIHYHTLANLQSVFESEHYNISTFFNCYAIVLGFTPAIMTNSGDFSMSITIIDQSLDVYTTSQSNALAAAASPSTTITNNTEGSVIPTNEVIKVMTLRLFLENSSKAPFIIQAGDVLCAHRISIQKYDNQMQLLGKKNVSSFLVIRPKNNEQEFNAFSSSTTYNEATNNNQITRLDPSTWNVIPTSLHTYTFSPFGESKCFNLWHWGQHRLHNHPTTISVVQFSINQLLPDDRYSNTSIVNSDTFGSGSNSSPGKAKMINGDITVIVMAVMKPLEQNNHSPVGFLRVWDGTGSSKADKLPTCFENELNDGYEDPFYYILKTLTGIINKVKTFHSSSQAAAADTTTRSSANSCSLVSPHALCGKIVNVAIWEESHWKLIESYSLCPGKFIRLRNVNEGCIQFDSNIRTRCLMVHKKSWLTLLPPTTFEISNLLLDHQGRTQRNDPTITCPRRLMLTDISHLERILDNKTHSRLLGGRQLTCIATVASEAPPIKFAIRFFITTTLPALTNNQIDGLKPLCTKSYSSPPEYKFHFLFHIRDHTDELDVYIPNDVAERFFQVQAIDMHTSSSSKENDGDSRSNMLHKKLFSKVNNLIINQTRLEGIVSSKQIVSKKSKKRQHFYIFESLYVDHTTN